MKHVLKTILTTFGGLSRRKTVRKPAAADPKESHHMTTSKSHARKPHPKAGKTAKSRSDRLEKERAVKTAGKGHAAKVTAKAPIRHEKGKVAAARPHARPAAKPAEKVARHAKPAHPE